ncbi:MAG: sulfatase-like hydrolase/transferase [Verrucomicrobia bacterium]|jgi:arylsulfatase A-like enzyme|nr:sulfatase-like hydrolase/transferase [Verrucomicrobiota bacterium]
MSSGKLPNILLIHSDQHRYDCVGAHGLRADVATPNLDRLAAGGTRFDHAFSTIPICTPARASLLTGALPTTHGSFCIPSSELNRAARPELPRLTDLLAEKGYRNAWTGKFHGETEHPPGPGTGVEEYASLWNGYHDFRKAQGLKPVPKPNGLFGNVDVSEATTETNALGWQADQIVRQIRERKDGPFFVRWDPPEPHLPCNPSPEFAECFAGADIPPWTSFPDTMEGKPAAQKRLRQIWGTGDWPWETWLRTVRLYYAIIAEMDHHIGRVLDELDELGLAEDTLVIYSSDHGDFCGGHGLMDKHYGMYDDIVRVPLILRLPGRVAAGALCPAFSSSSIDIARTILAAAEAEVPDSFVGRDLVALAREPGRLGRDYAFAQYFGAEGGAYSCRMLRDRRHKFVYHPVGDRHEFYDLETDPGELHNRIDDPDLAERIRRFKSDLFDTMKAEGDPLANRWTEIELKGAPSIAEAAFAESG